MKQVATRIGDVERDRAVELLREHHAAGRLELHEFTERMQQALAAKVTTDLTLLFEDLPGPTPLEKQASGAVAVRAWPTSGAWTEVNQWQLNAAQQRAHTLRTAQFVAFPVVMMLNVATLGHLWFLLLLTGMVLSPAYLNAVGEVRRLETRRDQALGPTEGFPRAA